VKYEWSGNITVDVPNDWTIHEPGNLIELVPPDESGALHITVLDRQRPGIPTREEAIELVNWFKERRGGEGRIETTTGSEIEARSRFDSADDGEPMNWIVVSKVWPDRAVLASYSQAPHSFSNDVIVDAIIKSIRP